MFAFNAAGERFAVSLRWFASCSATSAKLCPLPLRGFASGLFHFGRNLEKPGRSRSAPSTWLCTLVAGTNSPTLALPAASVSAR